MFNSWLWSWSFFFYFIIIIMISSSSFFFFFLPPPHAATTTVSRYPSAGTTNIQQGLQLPKWETVLPGPSTIEKKWSVIWKQISVTVSLMQSLWDSLLRADQNISITIQGRAMRCPRSNIHIIQPNPIFTFPVPLWCNYIFPQPIHTYIHTTTYSRFTSPQWAGLPQFQGYH